MFGRKTAAKAADNAATCIYLAGAKAGKKGRRAAEAVNSAVLRREYVECPDPNCPACRARR